MPHFILRPGRPPVVGPDREAEFTRLWQAGVLSKDILRKMNLGHNTNLPHMTAKRLGLKPRRNNPETTKSKTIWFKVTPSDHNYAKKRARSLGKPLAVYVRNLIRADRRKVEKLTEEGLDMRPRPCYYTPVKSTKGSNQ